MPRSDPAPHPVLEHPPPTQSVFFRLGQTVARRRWVVVAVWAVLFAGSLALAPRFEANLTGPPLGVSGSESMRAQAIIDQRFDHPIAEQDLVVFESERLTAADSAYREVVEESLQAVRHLSGVIEVVGPFDPLAEDQISLDGHVAVAVVGLSGSNETRLALAPRLTGAAASAATADVRVYVTGQSPLIAELVDQERQDLVRAELLGLPGAALVMLIASGTFVAAGLPPLLALAGGVVTFGVLGAATGFGNFNIFVPNLATMIGLGVGIDYSLFVVTRCREELARGADPGAAAATAVATAGKTIFVSGAAVLLSLAGLLLVDAEIFRELAFGAMTAVAVMMAGALTLLPAVLALLGHRVDRLRLPGRRPAAARVDSSGDLWARWARTIMRHPGRWAVAAVLVLAVLASPIRRLELALDTSTDALGQRPAGTGREILERDFNEGRISPVQVVLVSRDGPLDDRDLDAVARLSAALAQDWSRRRRRLGDDDPRLRLRQSRRDDARLRRQRSPGRRRPRRPGQLRPRPRRRGHQRRAPLVPRLARPATAGAASPGGDRAARHRRRERRRRRRRSERPDRRHHRRVPAQAAARRRPGHRPDLHPAGPRLPQPGAAPEGDRDERALDRRRLRPARRRLPGGRRRAPLRLSKRPAPPRSTCRC